LEELGARRELRKLRRLRRLREKRAGGQGEQESRGTIQNLKSKIP
jgi:hypothetical protein